MTADSKHGLPGEESALSRWSRRKLEARQQQAEPRQAPAAEVPAAQAVEPAVEAEQPPLTDADMPAIDSLGENSDYSQFMSSGVSDELRNLALRKLFHTPAFNIRDGLDEYDDDFTSFEKLGDIVTSDMKHRLEMEQQKLREKLAEEKAAGDEAETGSAELDAAEDSGEVDDEIHVDGASNDERLARLDAADEAAQADEGAPRSEQ